VPVIGDLDSVAAQALIGRFDAVSVSPAPGWTAVRLQQLAWELDCSPTALLVDPRLVPRASSRMSGTKIDGLPLLRLEHPGMRRVPRLVKGALDRLCALLALFLVAPVLLGCAVVVGRDGGRALDRRRRVGRGGKEFTLLTFRTTDGGGRPTPVGRTLQRHCLDELPQLLNVLGGSMSLVGPRPPGLEEDLTSSRARRCMLVKPGLTGLWLDDPAGDEPPGLDLRYVTQWTPAVDARILARTVRAALSSAGTHRPEH
jgi:lipopolysaccharide/colanic/teichoic acid biosynthesis glycosyltransferase